MRALAAALALLAVSPAIALAQSATGTLAVRAAVPANCVVATSTAVNFGTYDVAQHGSGAPLDVTVAAVSIACTKGAAGVSVALGDGEYARGSHRGMGGTGGSTVAYDIYTTQQRSTVWNAVNTVSYAAATSDPVSIPLYGRIPAGQKVAPGRYSDVLLAMVNF